MLRIITRLTVKLLLLLGLLLVLFYLLRLSDYTATFMQCDISRKIFESASICRTFNDPEWTLCLEVKFHVVIFQDNLTYAICISVKFLVRTTYDYLIQKLSHQFVAAFEASMPTLRTIVFDTLPTCATQRQVALKTILRVCDQIVAYQACQSVFVELVLIPISILLIGVINKEVVP